MLVCKQTSIPLQCGTRAYAMRIPGYPEPIPLHEMALQKIPLQEKGDVRMDNANVVEIFEADVTGNDGAPILQTKEKKFVFSLPVSAAPKFFTGLLKNFEIAKRRSKSSKAA